MRAAGAMKQTPATSNPAQRARDQPMWIAISVELGPGMRFVAPSMSRNCSCVSHPRRWTTSRSIMAMLAAGPPNDVAPSRRKSQAISRTEVAVREGSEAAFGSSSGFGEVMDRFKPSQQGKDEAGTVERVAAPAKRTGGVF